MGNFNDVIKLMDGYKDLGSRELANGTRLIGHVPHVGSEAYLHTVYPPLNDKKIKEIVKKIQRPLPEQLVDFYQKSNGLRMFANTFSISGLRETYDREGDKARQPSDLSDSNLRERPKNAQQEAVFFGFYEWDGSQTWMAPDDEKVYLCARYDAKPLKNWKGLDTFLYSEFKRLSKFFDKRGKMFDEDAKTTP